MKETKQEYWGPLAASFFFLGSLGAMMMVLITIFDILGLELVKVAGGWMALGALVVVAVGALLLVAELGNKRKIYYLHKPCIMIVGAVSMVILCICLFLYACFYITKPWAVWQDWNTLRIVIGIIGSIFGLVLTFYPAPELSEAVGRPFWNKGGLALFFFVSATTAAIAAVVLVNAFGPQTDLGFMNYVFAVALIIEAVVIFAYFAMVKGKHESAARSVQNITGGVFKNFFWIGVIVVGIVIPFICAICGIFSYGVLTIGCVCALIGGAILRVIMLLGGLRAKLPGEDKQFVSNHEIAHLAETLTARWEEKAEIVLNK